jgi:alpha-beta hydrolase superfamily lysophospholipase
MSRKPATNVPLRLRAESAGAGAKLHWHAWMPSGEAKAAVVLAHGYAEHLGRYEHFARALNAKGIAVYAVDHWGHGQSDGKPGFVPRFSAYTDGMELLLAMAQRRLPGLPLFLVGHSMGGLIAATHLVTHQSHYAGAVLSGPAIQAAEEPSRLLLLVSRVLSTVAPKLGVLALDSEGVSRDPAVVAAYRADPLVYTGKIGARLAAELVDAMAAVQANARRIELPMLLLHGAEDRLAAPAGSQFLHDHVSSADRQLKFYPGLYHEIFNEPERDAVIADVTRWIARHL